MPQDTALQIFTGEPGGGNYPVLVAFEGSDTADRLISAVEGIEAAADRIALAFERMATVLERAFPAPTAENTGDGHANL